MKIESFVYLADQSKPASQNVTLFQDGFVYDFSLADAGDEPQEISIYDAKRKSFVLVKPKQNIKFTISNSRLIQLTEALRVETSQNPKTKFLASADFDERMDSNSEWSTVSSDFIEYRYKGSAPRNVALMEMYNDFLEHYTLLSVTDPVGSPPFARQHLNKSIAKRKVIPTEIKLTIKKTPLLDRTISMKSRHTVVENLSESDVQRIRVARELLEKSKPVSLSGYRSETREEVAGNDKRSIKE